MKLLNFFKKKNNSNFNSVECDGVNKKDFEFLLNWTIYGEDKTLYSYTEVRIFSLEGIKTYVEQKELEFKKLAVSENCCIHFLFKHIREYILSPSPLDSVTLKKEIHVQDNAYLGCWEDGIIVVTPGVAKPWRVR